MAQSYLIFDFGGNEEAAQQARHQVDNWRQAFRLDKKLLLKFDRSDSDAAADGVKNAPGSGDSKKKAPPAKTGAFAKGGEPAERIQMIVRLDFSDHEKLSHQRWLERIPGEEPFKSASPRTVRPGDAAHAATAERFESLGDERGSQRRERNA